MKGDVEFNIFGFRCHWRVYLTSNLNGVNYTACYRGEDIDDRPIYDLYYRFYDNEDWDPIASASVSYSHLLEATYCIAEEARRDNRAFTILDARDMFCKIATSTIQGKSNLDNRFYYKHHLNYDPEFDLYKQTKFMEVSNSLKDVLALLIEAEANERYFTVAASVDDRVITIEDKLHVSRRENRVVQIPYTIMIEAIVANNQPLRNAVTACVDTAIERFHE